MSVVLMIITKIRKIVWQSFKKMYKLKKNYTIWLKKILIKSMSK